MEYILTNMDVKVIKESLQSHLKECEVLNKSESISVLKKCGLEEKIRLIKELLDNM